MKVFARIALAVALITAMNCGGSKGSSPTPTNPTPTITVAGVAPTLAAEINTTFKLALRSGVGTASRDLKGPGEWLVSVIDHLLSVPLSAQSGFQANCSRGGNIRIQNLVATPGGFRVEMSSTPVTVTSCGHNLNGRDVVATGTLIATGTWTATEPDTPVRLSGDLTVPDLGAIGINGNTGVSFNGNVGGITIGTPPTTSTTSTTSTSTSTSTTTTSTATTTTSVPGTTTSTTTSVATTTTTAPTTTTSVAPTTSTTTTSVSSGGVNVQGTWTAPGQTGALVITQNGSNLSCALTGLPAGTTSTSCGGTINGSTVTINQTLLTVVVAGPYTTTCTGNNILVATATSTTMVGTVTGTGSCTIAGPPPLPSVPPVPPTTTPVAFVKQ